MKLRNYCIVVLGETKGILAEITSVSDNEPNMLDAKDIVIATFSSFAETPELSDFFKDKGRNFLIFDLNPTNSGYSILKPDINEALFGFLKQSTDEVIRERTKNLIKELTATTPANATKRVEKEERTKISLEDIDAMSHAEKQILFNLLIEKGPNKLSAYDKKILKKLATS